jgi:hypothetical protein
VFLCYSALEQAKQLWLSYYSNGGNIYSNVPTKSDALLQGIEVYTNKCTKKLVSMIREILRSHYSPTFDDIEVIDDDKHPLIALTESMQDQESKGDD